MFGISKKIKQHLYSSELKKIYLFHSGLRKVQKSPLEKLWTVITFSLSTISLILIIFLADHPFQTAQKLISPLVNSWQNTFHSIFDVRKGQAMFSFAPGWAYKKFDKIDFTRLKTLAYYDISLNSDGTLVSDTDGYENLINGTATTLFQNAHSHGTNVVLTVTATYTPDIESFLNDEYAQQQAIQSLIDTVKRSGADGLAIDFEYTGTNGSIFADKYVLFVENISKEVKKQIANGKIVLAVTTSSAKQPFYNLPELTRNVDNVFVIADSFAVFEENNAQITAPRYGYSIDTYWKDINTHIDLVSRQIPAEKLVLERAWYGSGENYPFYPWGGEEREETRSYGFGNTMNTPLDQETVENLIAEVPNESQVAARQGIPLIAKALEQENILTPNVLAYALATIEHETAGTFAPIAEFKGNKSARRLGYEGGMNYYGRGYIQLTHLRNYKKIGQRIGMGDTLAQHPELASRPDIAARVLAAYFVDHNVANLVHDGQFVAARMPINPDYQGYWIASLAWKYRYMIG